uniref:HMA domain-containing protein n=1 Tax=Solanum lycopersicum TaxID=4081 RepID=A0A3Q7I692_SOLLC
MNMEEYSSFMTCILRININADRWQRTIAKVLKNVDVTNFRMNTDGTMELSGSVYPDKFLKILKKARNKAELCHLQFGQCSTNLFLPSRPIDYSIGSNKFGVPNNMLLSSFVGQMEDNQTGYYGGRDGRFLHYGDKPSQSKSEKKLEHAAGCINATTQRTKLQLDSEKGKVETLKSQGVNSCCLM